MNKYIIKYVWLPILILSGCTASLQQRADKTDNADSKRLEKRIDDLSSTITLIVNDTNRLHNKMEEVKTSNKAIQQKMEGLEVTVRNLNEQIVILHTSAKTPEIVQQPAGETEVKPQLPVTDTSKPSEKPAPDIQKPVNADSQMAVAKGFWDAMNAKDLQAVKSYVTKESADKLQVKDTEAPSNCKVSFGNIKIEDDKTIIDTNMQANDGTTEFNVQMQTILVKEEGHWKVDADQTMMSMFGGAMGEMMKGLGQALEEGFKKGFEEMGKSMAEGMQKGVEVMTQTGESKPDIVPPQQETVIVDQPDKKGLEESKQSSEVKPDVITSQNQETAKVGQTEKKGLEEVKQAGESKLDTIPPKPEAAFVSEEVKREAFLKDNIVRLAEAEFPDNKGIQWNIISLEHKTHLTYVVVEPNPATLDYPRFKFTVSFKNPEMPRVIGVFCFKDGQYSLIPTKKK